MKKMQFRGFTIKEFADGKFSASYKSSLGKTYSIERVSYCECGEWVWNIADNHDIGAEANHRMCRKWGRPFFTPVQGEGRLSL